MSEMLSQEEINQLFDNSNIDTYHSAQLTDMEKDTLGEVGNISMGAAATALHNLLDRRVTITTPVVEITNYDHLATKFSIPYVVVDVAYTEGLIGNNLLVIKTDDVKAITSLLLGGEYSDDESIIDELHLSTIGEVMNQMMGSSATSMSSLVDMRINIAPPVASVVNFKEDKIDFPLITQNNTLVAIVFNMEIEGLFSTELIQIMDLDFSKKIVGEFLKEQYEEDPDPTQENRIDTTDEKTMAEEISTKSMDLPKTTEENHRNEIVNKNHRNETVNVRPVQLESFNQPNTSSKSGNIEVLMDIPLQVAVELGRTKRSLKEIMELNIGSIITLDKLVGDTVDVVVNGKTIAKGEVVVCDDNFGVRIMDIISANVK